MTITVEARADLACRGALRQYRKARQLWFDYGRTSESSLQLALYYRARWDALRGVLDGS